MESTDGKEDLWRDTPPPSTEGTIWCLSSEKSTPYNKNQQSSEEDYTIHSLYDISSTVSSKQELLDNWKNRMWPAIKKKGLQGDPDVGLSRQSYLKQLL